MDDHGPIRHFGNVYDPLESQQALALVQGDTFEKQGNCACGHRRASLNFDRDIA